MDNKISLLKNLSFFCSTLLLISSNTLQAVTFKTYTAPLFNNETATLYIFNETPIIRGVVVAPVYYGSPLIATDTFYTEMYPELGLASLVVSLRSSVTENRGLEAYKSIEKALDSLAVSSKHPELKYSKMIFSGISYGGRQAFQFANYKPQRCISFIPLQGAMGTTHGSALEEIPTKGIFDVPALWTVAAKDDVVGWVGLSASQRERYNRARWCGLMTDADVHNKIRGQDVMREFIRETVLMRVPKEIPTNQDFNLITIPEENGYLASVTYIKDAQSMGRTKTAELYTYDKCPIDPIRATWFINEKFAKYWLSKQNWLNGVNPYSSAITLSITAPTHGANLLFKNEPITLSVAGQSQGSSLVKMEFFINDNLVYTDNNSADGWQYNWTQQTPGFVSLNVWAQDAQGKRNIAPGISFVTHKQTGAYNGTPHIVPGTIEAENYDEGGNNVAYFDGDNINCGSQYRTEGVDIETCTDQGGGYNVSYVRQDEWINYTISVKNDGLHAFFFRTASMTDSKIDLFIDNQPTGGSTTIPASGGWQTWKSIKGPVVNLTKGTHNVKVKFGSEGVNFNYILVSTDPSAVNLKNKTISASTKQTYRPYTSTSLIRGEKSFAIKSAYEFNGKELSGKNKIASKAFLHKK